MILGRLDLRTVCCSVLVALGGPTIGPPWAIADQTWQTMEDEYMAIDYRWEPEAPSPNVLVTLVGQVSTKPSFGCGQIDSISGSAEMRSHGHGMTTEPEVLLTGKSFSVQGLYFHMPGPWSIAIDVSCNGFTRRLEWNVQVN